MIKYTLSDQHGQGAITLLLEELSLQVGLLRERPDDPESLARECEAFGRLLAEELSSHFEQEESSLFPRAAAASGFSREIRDLVAEHRELLSLSTSLTSTIALLVADPEADVDGLGLVAQLDTLTTALQRHMSLEEAILRTVDV